MTRLERLGCFHHIPFFGFGIPIISISVVMAVGLLSNVFLPAVTRIYPASNEPMYYVVVVVISLVWLFVTFVVVRSMLFILSRLIVLDLLAQYPNKDLIPHCSLTEEIIKEEPWRGEEDLAKLSKGCEDHCYLGRGAWHEYQIEKHSPAMRTLELPQNLPAHTVMRIFCFVSPVVLEQFVVDLIELRDAWKQCGYGRLRIAFLTYTALYRMFTTACYSRVTAPFKVLWLLITARATSADDTSLRRP